MRGHRISSLRCPERRLRGLVSLAVIKQLPGPELRQIVLRAALFWELLRGAHIRYNCLLQERFGTSNFASEYDRQWTVWRQDMRAFSWSQWDTEAMWSYVLKAGGRVSGFTKKFVERWIELAGSCLRKTPCSTNSLFVRKKTTSSVMRACARIIGRASLPAGSELIG